MEEESIPMARRIISARALTAQLNKSLAAIEAYNDDESRSIRFRLHELLAQSYELEATLTKTAAEALYDRFASSARTQLGFYLNGGYMARLFWGLRASKSVVCTDPDLVDYAVLILDILCICFTLFDLSYRGFNRWSGKKIIHFYGEFVSCLMAAISIQTSAFAISISRTPTILKWIMGS